MGKIDLSRDYYGDLELEPGASDSDIKKQFKKLALKYHPDRNPGRESEVNSKFQTIQSAHEVLTDLEQKAKYDANRVKGAARAFSYGNPAPGPPGSAPTPHARGNPYSSAGSYWPPPPKPPPARKPGQPSAGAQRYEKFQPAGGAKKQEDPVEERKKTYQAYETMRSQGPKRDWQPPKPVDPNFTPKSGREESNNFKHPPPPKSSRPGYDEFRAGVPPRTNRRSPSPPSTDYNGSATPRRNGFMPSNLSGDEPPAANTSAYFTYRQGRAPSTQQRKPPDLPSRRSPNIDPAIHVNEQVGTAYEERLSTPYATQGGEKTNPFETLNRSKSTRERSEKVDPPESESISADDNRRSTSQSRARRHRPTLSTEFGPRVNSETNLRSSPKRPHPYARNTQPGEPSRAKARYTPTPTAGSETSSDGDEPVLTHQSSGTQPRTFAKKRAARQTEWSQDSPTNITGKPTSSTEANDNIPRKPSLSRFRQRKSFEAAQRNVLNYLQPDGPPRAHNASRDESGGEATNPSMYDNSKKHHSSDHPMTIYATIYEAGRSTVNLSKASTFPVVSEKRKTHRSGCSHDAVPFVAASSEAYSSRWPNLFPPRMKSSTLNAPSGVSLTDPTSLNAFETAQFELLDELVVNRSSVDHPSKAKRLFKRQSSREYAAKESHLKLHDSSRSPNGTHICRASTNISGDTRCFVSSPKEIRSRYKIGHTSDLRLCSERVELENLFRDCIISTRSLNANGTGSTSFTFNVPDEMLTAKSVPRPFASSSAENVNTAFSPDDWHGKFQAGEDYFGSESSTGVPRARSGSRSQGRSPIRGRRPHVNTRSQYTNIDPSIIDADKPTVSPKFSAEEWANTFKQQTFAPTATSSKPTNAPRLSRRTRVGSAAGKPLFGSMTAGTAAMVDESDSSDDNLLYMGQRRPSHSNPVNAQSPNAMDIDPPLESEARNVNVEPSRPEWRAGDANGLDKVEIQAAGGRPKLPEREAAKSGRRTMKPDDNGDFKTNLNDLKNIEPLNHTATGLNSFSDLNSTLPFTSQAASSAPVSRSFHSGQIEIPKPPKAPPLPSIARDAPRPTASSWQSYLAEFKAYMAQWTIFNTKIIAHFVARRDQIDSMPAGWVEAFGGSGIEKYREGLNEDVKIRAWWDVASTKHIAAVEEFMWCREVMKEGIQAAGSRPAANN